MISELRTYKVDGKSAKFLLQIKYPQPLIVIFITIGISWQAPLRQMINGTMDVAAIKSDMPLAAAEGELDDFHMRTDKGGFGIVCRGSAQ